MALVSLMAFAPPCTLWIATAIWFASLLPISACQVPVFRYALERWAAADCRVSIIPAETGLTNEEEAALAILRAASGDSINRANLTLEVHSPATGNTGPAQLELFYPAKAGQSSTAPIWKAPLTQPNALRLLDSPIRRELRRRLLAGQSAVWLLLESGEATKDEPAAAALGEGFAQAQRTLKLPEGVLPPEKLKAPPLDGKTSDVLRLDLPLKIEFSLLRLRRDDPDEGALIGMLNYLEDDLVTLAHEPMAFPVFGRGRILEPLIGTGIHLANVLEHSTYLCGACSCEVKDQNPGTDLLLQANWGSIDPPKLEFLRTAPAPKLPITSPEDRSRFIGLGLILLALGGWRFRRKPAAK